MIHHVILSPDAEDGVRSALWWYLEKGVNLPFRFGADLAVTLNSIARNPYQFPAVDGLVRRVLLKRFPYLVYFIPGVDFVYVIGVLHQRRLSPQNRP